MANFGEKKIVLFGAGRNGKFMLDKLIANGIYPNYFVDNKIVSETIEGASKEMLTFAVRDPKTLLTENKQSLVIIVTPDEPVYSEIKTQIIEMGLSECNVERLGNSAYFSCNRICRFTIAFNNAFEDKEYVAPCCESIYNSPAVSLYDAGKETIDSFVDMRNKLINDLETWRFESLFSKACFKCSEFKLGIWENKETISHVNLSMYPSPCQSKCIYCSLPKNHMMSDMSQSNASENFNRVFASLDYAIDSNLISDDTHWQVSCGEITIHPLKDRIMDITKNRTVLFFTNCFLFDKKIGANLKSNPHSGINLSIDAGTPQTWKQIKGVDNFYDVISNLEKYSKYSSRTGQIKLKYIVLPGINDSVEDYSAVIGIMKKLNVKKLKISRDQAKKYSLDHIDKLTRSTGLLVAMLKKADCEYEYHTYDPNEQEAIKLYANL